MTKASVKSLNETQKRRMFLLALVLFPIVLGVVCHNTLII